MEDGVYVGYHDDPFPEIPADKHREHVVQLHAMRLSLKAGVGATIKKKIIVLLSPQWVRELFNIY